MPAAAVSATSTGSPILLTANCRASPAPTPKPYIARLFITHDFAIGNEKESVESDANQLSGPRPVERYTIAVGRFSLTDYFDNNRYTHDPRSQFMGWAVMYNGAWDYAADVRGYTWGWVHELHLRNWSFRYASAFEPKVANGSQFDRRHLARPRRPVRRRTALTIALSHPGAVRLLSYFNHTDSGSYGAALQLAAATHTTPNVNNVSPLRHAQVRLRHQRGPGDREKYRRLHAPLAGATERPRTSPSPPSTALPPAASPSRARAGNAPTIPSASEFTAAGISAVHALYLSRGGLDFLLGDGALNYAPEMTWESYYNAHVYKWFYAAIDAQYITNPAYNRDRGPAVGLVAPSAH